MGTLQSEGNWFALVADDDPLDTTVGLQHAGLQPFPAQAQTGTGITALAPPGQAPRMVQLVEAALPIGLPQRTIRSVLEVDGAVADRLQRSPSGTPSITRPRRWKASKRRTRPASSTAT